MKKIGLTKKALMANKDAICQFLTKKGMSNIIGGYGGYTAYPDTVRYSKTIIVDPQ